MVGMEAVNPDLRGRGKPDVDANEHRPICCIE